MSRTHLKTRWTPTKGYIWNRLTDDWKTYGEMFNQNECPTTRTSMHRQIETMENHGLIEVLRDEFGSWSLYRLPQPRK